MVKQLIVVAMLLLNYDALEAIQSARAILNFMMLAQYILHNNETFQYMEYILNRLEKTKIAFED